MSPTPWFKVDDTLHAHPKARRAGKSAMGLWALAGSYCMAYKLDGQIDSEWIATQRGRAEAVKLCAAKFWHANGHDCEECPQPLDPLGFVFHDWFDNQPSAEEIERDREATRDRQRKSREKRRKAREESIDA